MNKNTDIQDLNTNDKFFFYNGNMMEFITPMEVNLENIFDNEISIKNAKYLKLGSYLGVDVTINSKDLSIIGRVIKCKIRGRFYEVKLYVEYFPDELLYYLEDIFDVEGFKEKL